MGNLLFLAAISIIQRTTSQNGIVCDDCTTVVGGGTVNAGDMFNPWAISYHILKPDFLVQFETPLSYDTVVGNLQRTCKTGFVYDFGALAYSPYAFESIPNMVAFPYYAFAIDLVYNIPGIDADLDPPLNLSREVVYGIFNFQITKWSDSRITLLNPTLASRLPDENITIVRRTDTTATTRALTKIFYSFNSTAWTSELGSTTFPSWWKSPNALNATSSFTLTSLVASTNYSIGYAPVDLAKQAGLAMATLINKAGKPVDPTVESMQAAVAALWSKERGFNFTLDPIDTDGEFAYPYTLISWVMFYKVLNLECDVRTEFFKFLNWCYTDSEAIAQVAGSEGSFAPLTNELTAYIVSQLSTFTCQTVSLLSVTYADTNLEYPREVAMVIASALMAFALTIMGTLVYTRNSRVTKAAGLAFAGAFLLGTVFNYIAVFFWALLPMNDAICQGRIVFIVLGYSLILGAMFSKSWEINKIFQRVEKGDISPFQEIPWWRFCRVFFILIAVQAVMLTILMATDPPTKTVTLQDPINLIGIHRCGFRHAPYWLGFEGTYFFLVMLWGAYLAYQTRTVWARYKYPNESVGILYSIYNLGFCITILSPLVSILDADEDILFVLVTFAIVYPTTFSLSSVYIPKIVSFLGSSFKKSKNSKGSKDSKGSSGPDGAQSVVGSRTTVKYRDDDKHESRVKRSDGKHSRETSKFESTKESSRLKMLGTPGTPGSYPLTPSQGPLTPVSSSLNMQHLNLNIGAWRVLINPNNPNNGEGEPIHESIFDNPELAAHSSLFNNEHRHP